MTDDPTGVRDPQAEHEHDAQLRRADRAAGVLDALNAVGEPLDNTADTTTPTRRATRSRPGS